MMKISRLSLLGIFALAVAAVASCGQTSQGQDENEEVDSLRGIERNVMEIHDDVMPKMGDLNNLIKKLKSAAQGEAIDQEMSETISNAIQDLVAADSLMWDWMYAYERPNYDGDLDSARSYLLSELERVTIVKDEMLSSLEQGTEVLEKTKGTDD